MMKNDTKPVKLTMLPQTQGQPETKPPEQRAGDLARDLVAAIKRMDGQADRFSARLEQSVKRHIAEIETLKKKLQTKERRLGGMQDKIFQLEQRYRQVLHLIAAAEGDDAMAYMKRLAVAASEGPEPGSLPWAFTTRILADRTISSLCPLCGINCYGAHMEPCAMPCNVAGCPYEEASRRKPLNPTDLRQILAAAANLEDEDEEDGGAN